MPEQWVISRICESFSCVPSVAERELDSNPELVFDILLLREYARIKHAIENAKTKDQVPTSPLVEWWGENEIASMQARQAESNG